MPVSECAAPGLTESLCSSGDASNASIGSGEGTGEEEDDSGKKNHKKY